MTAELDVVIPAHPKDFATVDLAVACVLSNLPETRNVYIVSVRPYSNPSPRVRHIPEPIGSGLPTADQIRERWQAACPELAWRAGWLYQQILGLGAGQYIEELQPAYVCIDADTLFLRPVQFLSGGTRFTYCDSPQITREEYADAHRRLTGEEQLPHSFTSHHLHLDQELLAELFAQIEQLHGKPWHEAYVDCVDFSIGAPINEQDTYGSWVVTHHPGQALRRPLAWADIAYVPNRRQRRRLRRKFDFVAAHAYMRQPLIPRLRKSAAARGGHVVRRIPRVGRALVARRG
jgi:hypothetical protein